VEFFFLSDKYFYNYKYADYQLNYVKLFNNSTELKHTVYAIYLEVLKINNSNFNYLGSFIVQNLSLKKHRMNKKIAVHRTVPPYNVIDDWLLVVPSMFLRSCKAIKNNNLFSTKHSSLFSK